MIEILFYYFFFLVSLPGLWDFTSWTRNGPVVAAHRTQALSNESEES